MGRVVCRASARLTLAVGLALVRHAAAEFSVDDKALATALFQEGRALMAAGRSAEACPKLEESQRLDPSSGTLLNLALCHEKEGKLARSWSEFGEAMADARRDHRADREAAAEQHLRNLEPRLSRLIVVVPKASRIAGLHVELDGRELLEASWSLAIPVDGADHVVRATAAEHEPFSTTVLVAAEAAAVSVEIPVLLASPAPLEPPASSPVLVSKPVPVEAEPRAVASSATADSSRRYLAWTTISAGAAQLAVAGYFGLRAFDLHAHDSEVAAGHDADASTILTLTGLATTGVGLYWLTTTNQTRAPSSRSAAFFRVALGASSIRLSGGF